MPSPCQYYLRYYKKQSTPSDTILVSLVVTCCSYRARRKYIILIVSERRVVLHKKLGFILFLLALSLPGLCQDYETWRGYRKMGG